MIQSTPSTLRPYPPFHVNCACNPPPHSAVSASFAKAVIESIVRSQHVLRSHTARSHAELLTPVQHAQQSRTPGPFAKGAVADYSRLQRQLGHYNHQGVDREHGAKRRKILPAAEPQEGAKGVAASSWFVSPISPQTQAAGRDSAASITPVEPAANSNSGSSGNDYMDDELWDSSAHEAEVPTDRHDEGHSAYEAEMHTDRHNKTQNDVLHGAALTATAVQEGHSWGDTNWTDWRKAMVKIRQGGDHIQDTPITSSPSLVSNKQPSSSTSDPAQKLAGSRANRRWKVPRAASKTASAASVVKAPEPCVSHSFATSAGVATAGQRVNDGEGLGEKDEARVPCSADQTNETGTSHVSREEALVWDLYGDMLRKMQGGDAGGTGANASVHPTRIKMSVLVGSESESIQTLLRDSGMDGESEVRPAVLTTLMKECCDWEELQEVVAAHGHRFNHIHVVMAVQRLPRIMQQERGRERGVQRLWQQKGWKAPPYSNRPSAAQASRPAVTARQGLQYALLVQRIFELLMQQLPAMGPRELSGTMHALGKLSKIKLDAPLGQADHCPPDDLLAELLRMSHLKLKRMGGIQLVNLIWGCAALKLELQETWMQAWFNASQPHLQHLSCGDLSTAIMSLANLRQPPTARWFPLWQSCAQQTWSQDAQPPVRAISNSIWALATLQLQPTSTWLHAVLSLWPVHTRGVTSKQGRYRSSGVVQPAPVDSAMLLWGVAKLGMDVDDVWLRGVLVDVEQQLQEFSPQDLANTIWALATLRHSPSPSLSHTYLEVSYLTMDDFTLHELATMLWGLGKLQQQPPERWHQSLLAVCHDMLQQGERIRLDDVALLLAGLVHSQQVPSSWWLEHVWRSTEGLLQGAREQELAMLCWAVGKMKVTPPDSWMHHCMSRLLHLSPTLSPEQAGAILWSLGVVQVQHEPAAVDQLLGGVRALLPRCDAVQLEKMAWGLYRLRHVPDPLWQASFLAATQQHIPHMKACTLANVVTSAAALGMQPQDEWLAAVISRTLQMASSFSFPQLRRLLYGFKRMARPKTNTSTPVQGQKQEQEQEQEQGQGASIQEPQTYSPSNFAAQQSRQAAGQHQQAVAATWHEGCQTAAVMGMSSVAHEGRHVDGVDDVDDALHSVKESAVPVSGSAVEEEDVVDELWDKLTQGDAELLEAMAELQAVGGVAGGDASGMKLGAHRLTGQEAGLLEDERVIDSSASVPTFESLLEELRLSGAEAWGELVEAGVIDTQEGEEDGDISIHTGDSTGQKAADWGSQLASLLDELSNLHPETDSIQMEEENVFGNHHTNGRLEATGESLKGAAGCSGFKLGEEHEDVWAAVAAQFAELDVGVRERVGSAEDAVRVTRTSHIRSSSGTREPSTLQRPYPHRPSNPGQHSVGVPQGTVGGRKWDNIPHHRSGKHGSNFRQSHKGHQAGTVDKPGANLKPDIRTDGLSISEHVSTAGPRSQKLLPDTVEGSGRWWDEWTDDGAGDQDLAGRLAREMEAVLVRKSGTKIGMAKGAVAAKD